MPRRRRSYLLEGCRRGRRGCNDAFHQNCRRNHEPGTMVAYGADAAFIVIDAIKKVGPDRAKIRDAIENTKGYVGMSGIYNISPQDHNGLSMKDIVMIKATKGSWTLIE
ncbi:MAG: hypothetical protein JRE10_10665 [Deltaproteobacteria bacterium]|nr:hypothetical protein [Deltaproteobacteria bacterium]